MQLLLISIEEELPPVLPGNQITQNRYKLILLWIHQSWLCHFDDTQAGKQIICRQCKLCVCVHVCARMCVRARACVCAHFFSMFAHSLILGGACKSGKFLAQLVLAVSIPCGHVFLYLCVCACACVGLGRVNVVSQNWAKWSQLPWHQMSEQNLCWEPSKNSCCVRWWRKYQNSTLTISQL